MKTSIVSVDIRDDNSIIVYYSTGTYKPYRNMEKIPGTVRQWLADHPEPAPVTVTATPEGVEIRTADPEQAPAECTAIVVAKPAPAEMATVAAPVIISPPAAVNAEIDTPERLRLAPLAVVELAALGATYNGLMVLALAAHTAAIAAEIAEATVEVIQDIGTDTGTAIHRTGHRLRHTAGRITQAATRATRMAAGATWKAWGIISTNAVQTATSVAIWAREAWAWREELVTAETIMG